MTILSMVLQAAYGLAAGALLFALWGLFMATVYANLGIHRRRP